MSKKNFTDGLESLFADLEEGALDRKAGKAQPFSRKEKPSVARSKKDGGEKKLTDELDELLQSAFRESLEEEIQKHTRDDLYGSSPRPRRRRRTTSKSGLDSLIRRTVETSEIELNYDQPARQRISLAFDPDLLEKLREIARLEKTYLKDIIGQVIEEYIHRYEQKKPR